MKKIVLIITFLSIGIISCFANNSNVSHSSILKRSLIKGKHAISKTIKQNRKNTEQGCTEYLTIQMTDAVSFTVSASGATCADAYNNAMDLANSVGDALEYLAQYI